MIEFIVGGLILISAALYLRIRVLIKSEGFGCDAFYFLVSVREFKKKKKLPHRLPYYFLDIEEQWYPPGFVVFLSLFPEKFLGRFHKFINPFLEVIHLGLLYVFTYYATGRSVVLAVASGLVYAAIPNLNTENLSMNVRALASLFNTALFLSFVYYTTNPSLTATVFFVVSAFLVFMTHKMAVQNLIFYFLAISIIKKDFYYLVVLAAIVGFVLVASGGFYLKILRAHLDILFFWKKNLKNLCVHQYKDSPVYGGSPSESLSRFHRPGFQGFIKHLRIIAGFNPFVVFLVIYPFVAKSINLTDNLIYLWGALTYAMVFLTTFVAPFRFLGEGWKYIKFAAFPTAYITAKVLSLYSVGNCPSLYILFLSALCVSIFISVKLQNRFRQEHTMGIIDEDIYKVFDYIKGLPADGVVCVPTHISDALVYHTGKKVLWGGHSLVSRLESFFPVVNHPIEYYINKYRLSYLLLDTTYMSEEDLRIKYPLIYSAGKYKLFATQ